MRELRFWGVNMGARATRRRVVILMYGMFGLSLLLSPLARYAAFFPLIPGLWAYWPVYQFTKRFVIHANECVQSGTDERETRVLEAAMTKAYHYVCAAVMLGFLWMMFAADGLPVWTPHTAWDWNWVILAFLMVSQSVPQAIISWNEPDVETAAEEHAMQLGRAL